MSKQRRCLIVIVGVLTTFAHPSLAWQERSIGGDTEKAAAASRLATPNLDLNVPDLTTGKELGTEVRIPGIGTLGVLPKFDFGLELLYGANEPGRPDDKSQPSDVQLRATIKHRF